MSLFASACEGLSEEEEGVLLQLLLKKADKQKQTQYKNDELNTNKKKIEENINKDFNLHNDTSETVDNEKINEINEDNEINKNEEKHYTTVIKRAPIDISNIFFKKNKLLENCIYKSCHYDYQLRKSHGIWIRIYFEYKKGEWYWEDAHCMNYACNYNKIDEIIKRLKELKIITNPNMKFPKLHNDLLLENIFNQKIAPELIFEALVCDDIEIKNEEKRILNIDMKFNKKKSSWATTANSGETKWATTANSGETNLLNKKKIPEIDFNKTVTINSRIVFGNTDNYTFDYNNKVINKNTIIPLKASKVLEKDNMVYFNEPENKEIYKLLNNKDKYLTTGISCKFMYLNPDDNTKFTFNERHMIINKILFFRVQWFRYDNEKNEKFIFVSALYVNQNNGTISDNHLHLKEKVYAKSNNSTLLSDHIESAKSTIESESNVVNNTKTKKISNNNKKIKMKIQQNINSFEALSSDHDENDDDEVIEDQNDEDITTKKEQIKDGWED
jgi:hypothetical protein